MINDNINNIENENGVIINDEKLLIINVMILMKKA